MLITVIKTTNYQTEAVRAELNVDTLEALVQFASSLGVQQSYSDYAIDFMEAVDRTYVVGLEQ